MSASPEKSSTNMNENSPWTDAFQFSPVHQDGRYDDSTPQHDDTQEPTWTALGIAYDDDLR